MPPIPPAESMVLFAMRRSRGLSAAELARLAGISTSMITRYEKKLAPSPERLDELGALMGYDPEHVALLLLAFREDSPLPDRSTPVDPTPAERLTLRRAALELSLALGSAAEDAFLELFRAGHVRTARRAAGRLW